MGRVIGKLEIFVKMLANRNQGSTKLVSLRTTFQIIQVVYFPSYNAKSGQKKLTQEKTSKPRPDGEGRRHIGVSSIGPNCAKPSSKATEPLEPGGQGEGGPPLQDELTLIQSWNRGTASW